MKKKKSSAKGNNKLRNAVFVENSASGKGYNLLFHPIHSLMDLGVVNALKYTSALKTDFLALTQHH